MVGHRGRVLSCKARTAELIRTDKVTQSVYRQIAKGIGAYDLCGLLYGMMAGYEILLRIDIRAVVAGMKEGRSGYAEVYLPGTCFTKKRYYPSARRAPDYGIIHKDYAFAFYRFTKGGKLYHYLVGP